MSPSGPYPSGIAATVTTVVIADIAQSTTIVMDKHGGQMHNGSGFKLIDQSHRQWPQRSPQLMSSNLLTNQLVRGHTDHPQQLPPAHPPPYHLSPATTRRAFDSKSTSFLPYIPIINVTPFTLSGVRGQTTRTSSLAPPITSPLFTILTKSMCRALDFESRSFLPQDQLNALTPPMVKEELKRAMPNLSEYVLDKYTAEILAEHGANHECPQKVHRMTAPPRRHHHDTRLAKTFVILVLLGKTESIPSFISGGFTDSLLPIDYSLFSVEKNSQTHSPSLALLLRRCFEKWPLVSIERFLQTQWVVLSPFLHSVKRDVSLYSFNARIVLPIFENDGTTKTMAKKGGFGIVRRVKIHSWHHSFREGQDEPFFALKRLDSPHIKDFRREVAALRRFVISPHTHIIKLLAAFRHGTSFYLLFPWAEGGSLHSFWKDNPNPSPDSSLIIWIVEQCIGLATALHQIHQGNHTEASNTGNSNSPTDVSYYGIHGDIKPANILLFENRSRSENPILVLTDFGLVHGLHETKVGGRPTGFSPTYRAPEIDIKGTINSAYDIWSLGCVFLETTVWLLRGWDGVESFALSRFTTGKPSKKAGWIDDNFFELVTPQFPRSPNARLKPIVNQCFENLARGRETSPCIADFLDLTHDDLLDINWETRINSSFLAEKLECLRQKCLEDPVYTVALPRPRKPPWLDRALQSYKDNISALNFQTQPIRVNMAQIPTFSDELEYPDMMPVPSHDLFWPNFNEQPQNIDNNTDIFNAPIDQMISPDTMLDNMLQDAFTNESLPILHERPPNETLFRSPNGRRRTLDDLIGPVDMGDQRKKKARKKKDMQTKGSPNCRQLEIANQDLSQQTTQGYLEPTGTTGGKRLFACPFHKRNPTKYNTKAWRSCMGPGWTISRLKEHIYRRHFLSCYRCDRCFSEFQSSSALHAHSRSDPPCYKSDSDFDFDTIDEAQKAQIKKKPRGVSDEQKWDEIYRIIFKLDSTAEVPSPYCETIIGGVDAVATAERTNNPGSLADFEIYLHQLASDNEQDMSAINSCLDLVRQFQQGLTGSQPGFTVDMPSLAFDYPDDGTRTSESQGFPSLATADDGMGVPNAEALNDLSCWDTSFEARFNGVFLYDKSFNASDALDLGGDGGMLSEG